MRIVYSTCLPKFHRANLTSEIKQENEIKCTEIRESQYTWKNNDMHECKRRINKEQSLPYISSSNEEDSIYQ